MINFFKLLLLIFILVVDLQSRDSDEVSVFTFAEDIKKVQQEKKDSIKTKKIEKDIVKEIQNSKKEEIKKETFDKEDVENRSYEFTKDSTIFNPKTLFVSYKELPVTGYVGEMIPLMVRVIVTEKFDEIKVEYEKNNGILYNFKPSWRKDSDNTYEKTIYFQPKTTMEKLPKFKVSILKNGKIIESSNLPDTKLNIIKLNDDDGRFINVFANNLTVKKFKTTQFNDSALIMIMELQTSYASLNNIKFNNIIKQGIDSKFGEFPDVKLYYFLVFSNDTASINFSYFNTTINDFEIINLPVIVEQDDLSTQIGLNPKKSKFELYKDIGLGVLVIILLGFFIYSKKYIYAFLAIVLSLYIFYVRGTTTLTIKSGSKIRILPTEKSTIFYTISTSIQAEELNSVKPYIKVLLPNKKIGWVKEEDVIKN